MEEDVLLLTTEVFVRDVEPRFGLKAGKVALGVDSDSRFTVGGIGVDTDVGVIAGAADD
jgi:hypothetical protein